MEPIITRPDAADIEAAAQIAGEAWTPVFECFRAQLGDELFETFIGTDWKARKIDATRREMAAEESWVTKIDGKVVAFIAYRVSGKYAEILGNAVDPACQGMGLGTAQYRFVLDRMREAGAEYVSVTTGGDDGHAPARRAYEAVGFKAFTPSRTYRMKL